MHYNNVSCILDVCFTLLQCCVLVGLDWAEPMMFLLLHTTCSCIFMHTYLQFFIFFYFNFGCVFLLFSLSLSLSLSLEIVCVMAPKCKSTPSQNPLHFGAFSSNPTPSYVWFSDEKAKSDFKENFSQCSIHSERPAKSFYRIFPILTFPLSSTVMVRSHCVASQSLVLL